MTVFDRPVNQAGAKLSVCTMEVPVLYSKDCMNTGTTVKRGPLYMKYVRRNLLLLDFSYCKRLEGFSYH